MHQANHSESRTGATNEVILVVDDDPFLLRLVCKQLEKLGQKAQAVPTGAEALELLAETSSVALVLLDFQMPNTNGVELAKLIRQIELHRSTPIILMTATSSFTCEVPANSGINGLLAKPFTINQLERIINQWSSCLNETMETTNARCKNSVDDEQFERTGTPVFDLQKLRGTFGDEDCLEVIRTFATAHANSPKRLLAAREAVALPELKALAHKLKGAASMACLKELAQTSGLLEQASARADWAEIDKLLHQLPRQFERAEKALSSVLAGKT